MGEARQRHSAENLIDDAAEYELEVSDRSMHRLQLQSAELNAAEQVAQAAAGVAASYREKWFTNLGAVAEAAGYGLPQYFDVVLDTKAAQVRVYAKRPREDGQGFEYVGDGPPQPGQDRRNGHHVDEAPA